MTATNPVAHLRAKACGHKPDLGRTHNGGAGSAICFFDLYRLARERYRLFSWLPAHVARPLANAEQPTHLARNPLKLLT